MFVCVPHCKSIIKIDCYEQLFYTDSLVFHISSSFAEGARQTNYSKSVCGNHSPDTWRLSYFLFEFPTASLEWDLLRERSRQLTMLL